MNETLFFVLGAGLAALAVITSFVGLRVSRFPGSNAAMVAIIAAFAVLVCGTTAFAVRHAKDEEAHEEAVLHQGGKEAEREESGAEPPTAATGPGKELFTQSCGSCHTLADAGTSGTVGPNLDDLEPEASRVETAIRVGGAGTGAMPANIYSGKQAEQVAEYVAAVAGEG
jgi:mono/diheme cytochrome c family protein